MVQTEQQFICIHQCLMAVLEGKENTGPPREIHDNQGYEGEWRHPWGGQWLTHQENFLISFRNSNASALKLRNP